MSHEWMEWQLSDIQWQSLTERTVGQDWDMIKTPVKSRWNLDTPQCTSALLNLNSWTWNAQIYPLCSRTESFLQIDRLMIIDLCTLLFYLIYYNHRWYVGCCAMWLYIYYDVWNNNILFSCFESLIFPVYCTPLSNVIQHCSMCPCSMHCYDIVVLSLWYTFHH